MLWIVEIEICLRGCHFADLDDFVVEAAADDLNHLDDLDVADHGALAEVVHLYEGQDLQPHAPRLQQT